jgi:hypothetical protein
MSGPANLGLFVLSVLLAALAVIVFSLVVLRGRLRSILAVGVALPILFWGFYIVAAQFIWPEPNYYVFSLIFGSVLLVLSGCCIWQAARLWPKPTPHH